MTSLRDHEVAKQSHTKLTISLIPNYLGEALGLADFLAELVALAEAFGLTLGLAEAVALDVADGDGDKIGLETAVAAGVGLITGAALYLPRSQTK